MAETQPVLFCTEKQEIDKLVMAGKEHKVPKATSHHGNPVYFDPNDAELAVVQHYRKQDVKALQEKRKAKEFQNLLKTIPKVDYFPTTRLAEMYAKSGILGGGSSSGAGVDGEMSGITATPGFGDSQSSVGDGGSGGGDGAGGAGKLGEHSTAISGAGMSRGAGSVGAGVSMYSSLLQSDLSWQSAEHDFKAAMRAAKAGDTKALVEFNLRNQRRVLAPIDRRGSSPLPPTSS